MSQTANCGYQMRSVADRFFEQLISARDRRFIELCFDPNPTQEKLNAFLDQVDIEACGGNYAVMLSYLMKERPELQFRAYELPRLQGLLNFLRFSNLRKLSYFSQVGKALNAAEITPVLFKGGAMKFLRPELGRPMGDVDILVPPEKLLDAVKIAMKQGFDAPGYFNPRVGEHAIGLYTSGGEDAVDLHKFFFEVGEKRSLLNEKILSRARKTTAFGVDIYLPRREDLLFLSLVNLMKNLIERTSLHGLIFAFFDFKFLLADPADFDWSLVDENAKLTRTESHIAMAKAFAARAVPGLFPPNDAVSAAISERFIEYSLFNAEFYGAALVDYRNCRWKPVIAKIKGAAKALADYARVKSRLLFLRGVRRSSALTRFYLNWHLKK